MSSFIIRLFGWSASARNASKRKHGRRNAQPILEYLEKRLAPALAITSSTLPTAYANHAYNQTVGVSGATGAVTFTVSEGSLPAGFTLNSATGAITGNPTTGVSAIAGTLTTLASFNSTNGASPTNGVVEDSYGDLYGTTSAGGSANDGTIFEIVAGSGTITTLATFNGTGNGSSPMGNLLLDGHGNLFGTTSAGGASNDGTVFEIPAGTGTIDTLATFNGTNGSTPITGLTEDANGDLFGTTYFGGGAANDGTVFEVASGSNTITTLVTFTGTANGANPNSNLVAESAGDLFGATANGGSSNDGTLFKIAAGTRTFTTLTSFTGGANGAGPSRGSLLLDATGDIFGTTGGGTYNEGTIFELSAGSQTVTTLYTFSNGTYGVSPQGLIQGSNGYLYGTTQLNGGSTSANGTVFQFSTSTDTLTQLTAFTYGKYGEPDIIEDASGNLFGTTQSGGANGDGTVYEVEQGNFTITATDSTGASASQYYNFTVDSPLVISSSLPNWSVNRSYAVSVQPTGGTGSITCSLTSGSLPTGLSLASYGQITGTPSAVGSYSFTITATDSVGGSVSQAYFVVINPTLTYTTSSLPAWTVGQSYNQDIAISGGTSPFTFSLTSGSLPTGLTLNTSTGAITGTPNSAGAFSPYIRVTDSSGYFLSRTFGITINALPAITPTSLPSWGLNQTYAATLAASGGTGADTFALVAGSLVPGLTLNTSTGVISGTPTATGYNSYSFIVSVTDSTGAVGYQTLAITNFQAPSITTTSLPSANTNETYSQTIQTSGGLGNPTFSVSAGSLPIGLTLNSLSGAITGAPTTATFGTFGAIGTGISNANTGLVFDSSGDLFGTAQNGGTSSDGSLFEIPAGTHTSITLVSFNGSGNGALPVGGLAIDGNGNIYGTTAEGGSSNDGTLFEYSIAHQTLTTLVTFIGTVNGSSPQSNLIEDSSGDLFGLTQSGGSAGDGTLFEWQASTQTSSTIVTFTAGHGSNLVADGSGDLFGVGQTATNNSGTIFELTAGSHTLTQLYSSGLYSFSSLAMDSSGDLFCASGTTLFEISANTTFLRPVATVPGSLNTDSLAVDGSGNLVGTTANGGSSGEGLIYELPVGSSSIATLFSFQGNANGSSVNGLIETSGDVFYGTTAIGGADNDGTVFELTPSIITITATDSDGASSNFTYALNVIATPIITTTSLPNGTVNESYNQTVAASGGLAPLIFSKSAGTLPTGLTLNTSTGAITGTPSSTTGSPFTFTITVTDSEGTAVSQSYTVAINSQLTITTTTLPSTVVGHPYSQTIATSGGANPITFAVSSGSLPAGLTLNTATGVISGAPTTATGSPFSFTIRATDATAGSASANFTLTIYTAPTIITSLPNWTINRPYSQTIVVAGGVSPITFAVTSGSLPTGLSLNTNTGTISGTPISSSGSPFSFTITATDAETDTASQSYSIAINALPAITTTALPAWTVGQSYSHTITTTGGTNPDTFAVTGSLPPGLTLNTTSGAIIGTPTTAVGSPFSFTVGVTDAAGAAASQSYSLTIYPSSAILTTLPNWTVNQPYNQTITVTGDTNPVAFAVTAGALPPGLTLNTATGTITGTPSTTAGSPFAFTITATDSFGAVDNASYHVTINSAPTLPASLPNWTVGEPYSQTVTATGGTGPITYALSAGYLPPGMNLNTATGALTLTTIDFVYNGTWNFTITATDAAGATVRTTYTLVINPEPLFVTPTNLPYYIPYTLANGLTNVPYSQTLSVTGGTAPLDFTAANGSLPPGLSLNSATGVISGTPTTVGSYYDFSLDVIDATGAYEQKGFTIVIAPGRALNPTLPSGTLDEPYAQTLSVSADSDPATFAITAGHLAPGLSLNADTGAITGTPTTATGSPFAFTITATDSASNTFSQAYSLTINPLPYGTVGQPYDQTVPGDGVNPETFSVTSGSLPPGLSLNSNTGAITGTPTDNNGSPFTFVINVSDAEYYYNEVLYTMVINPAATISPLTLPNWTVDQAYNQTITLSGPLNGIPSDPVSYSVSSGGLPPGLSLNYATGAITGTPTSAMRLALPLRNFRRRPVRQLCHPDLQRHHQPTAND